MTTAEVLRASQSTSGPIEVDGRAERPVGTRTPAWARHRRPACARRLLLAVGLVERRLQSPGELDRVVGGPEVHVEEPRRVLQSVVVERRDVDAMLPQGPGDGIHFLVDEYEIAGDRGLPIRRRLEVHYRRDAHGGQQRPPHRGDRFRAGYGHLEHAADVSPRTTEHLLNLLGVEPRAGGGGSGPPAPQ